MNNYSIKQTSMTACNVVVCGVLAGQGLNNVEASAITNGKEQRLNLAPYEVHSNSPSFSQISNVFSSSLLHSVDQEFTEAVSNVYAQLIENQEPLGQEFEQVLYDNIWDLYES